METKEAIKVLQESLRKNNNISRIKKIDAEILLNDLGREMEAKETREILGILKNIYADLTYEPEKEALQEVIRDYEFRVRRDNNLGPQKYNIAFDDFRPINFERVLGSLSDGPITKNEDGSITFKPRNPDLLEKTISIGKDDGMGYCPGGFDKVFSGYQDEDDIKLWI